MPKGNDSKALAQSAAQSAEVDKPLLREKLPKELQKLVDDEDTLLEQIYDGK